MKKIYQYRKNIPNELDNFPTSNIINGIGKIIKFGIQATPGTRFSLNSSDDNIILIGPTGVYEIDLDNSFVDITSIKVILIEDDNGPCIIDIIAKE